MGKLRKKSNKPFEEEDDVFLDVALISSSPIWNVSKL